MILEQNILNLALDPVVNFGKVTVSTGYTSTDTTPIILSTGDGIKLPASGYNLVWWNWSDHPDPSDDPNVEIVRVLTRSGDALSITRAQEGTSASNKNLLGRTYKMILTQTKQTIADIQTDAQSKVDVHAALTSSVHNFDASGNAPPQIHAATSHDGTTVDGGAALSSTSQIPAHGSSRHTGTIGAWDQIDKTTSDISDITTKSHSSLSDIGTNTHSQIDTHISSIAAHGISAGLDASKSGSPVVGQRYIAVDTLKDYECFVAGTWREITANPPMVHGIASHTGTIGAWASIDKTTSNISDITTKSHTSLTDIGTNSHSAIDTAITNSVNHIAASTGIHGTTGNLVATGAAVTGQYSSARYTITQSTSPTADWNNGNVQYLLLQNAAHTFTFNNPRDGGRYMLILKQPASGTGTVTWPGTVLWSGGTAPTLTATINKVDVLTFAYDSTNGKYYGGSALNY